MALPRQDIEAPRHEPLPIAAGQEALVPPTARVSGKALPRVAIVAHGIHDHGGMERALAEVIKRIHDRFEVVVVSSDLGEELHPLVRWERVWVPKRPIPLRFALFYFLASVRLKAMNPDIAHTVGAIVPNKVDVASVHFCTAGFVEKAGGLSPASAPIARRLNKGLTHLLGLLAERWSYRSARVAVLLPVSSGLARELGRHYPSVRAVVAANGVDRERFRPNEQTRLAVRSELGAAQGEVVVLFVGGDWHQKGLALAIAGVAATRETGASIRLVIVGPGDQSHFKRLARELAVADQVTFMGVRSDTERLYAAADVFLLTSCYETFSLAAFEAASSGVPIVAPQLNGVEDLVGGNEAGIIVDRTPESVAAALVELAESPDLRRRLGDAGRKRAAAYTWEGAAEVVVAAYQSVLRSTSRQTLSST
jgi:glycosyltransferase involved in cell wall biosynthesis